MPGWVPFPPAWMLALGFLMAAVTMLLRWHVASTSGGRLHIFLAPTLGWLAFVYLMAHLRAEGFTDAAALAVYVRLCLLILSIQLTLIDGTVFWQEWMMRRRLRGLGLI